MTKTSTLKTIPTTLIVIALAATAFSSSASAKLNATEPSSDWQAEAERLVDENMNYPFLAKRRGEAGIAHVKVNVDAQGKVLSYELTRSSGSSVLDREARRTIERIGAFPALQGADTESFTVRLKYDIES